MAGLHADRRRGRISRLVLGFFLIIGWGGVAVPAHAQQIRVFATSSSGLGNVGGLAAADAICNDLADSAGLGGEWVAWLSTSSVNAIDRLTPGSGPIVRASDTGTIIANDLADLTDGSLQNIVVLDENGAMPPTLCVWTGTTTAGVLEGDTCSDWTVASPTVAMTGDIGTAGNSWTQAGLGSCDDDICGHYCFELPAASVPAASWRGLAALAATLALAGASIVAKRHAGRSAVGRPD